MRVCSPRKMRCTDTRLRASFLMWWLELMVKCFSSIYSSVSTSDYRVWLKTKTCVCIHTILRTPGTVFVYGATGAGKTHTMLGTEQHPGIILRTIEDLFSVVAWKRSDAQRVVGSSSPSETSDRRPCSAGCVCSSCCVLQECDISVSYLEVYNEKLR